MPTGRELRRLVAETGPDGVHPNRGWVYDAGQRAQYILNDLRDLDGHHTPLGNAFTAWAVMDQVVDRLNPGPVTYRSGVGN